MSEDVTAILAAIRERASALSVEDVDRALPALRKLLVTADSHFAAEIVEAVLATYHPVYRSDSAVLLAAVEAALKDHRKSMFPAGPPGAGNAYGKHYCAGICYASIDDQVIYRVWPCRPYQDITAALSGKEAGDAGT